MKLEKSIRRQVPPIYQNSIPVSYICMPRHIIYSNCKSNRPMCSIMPQPLK